MALLFLLFLHLQRRRRPRTVHLTIGQLCGPLHLDSASTAEAVRRHLVQALNAPTL